MATNNNGTPLDDAGNVVVDFVWGNFPLQPNDVREEGKRLDFALDNHVLAQVGWNGYPGYEPNTTGSAVDIDSPADGIQDNELFLTVPTVIGFTTALAADALKDAGFATVNTPTPTAGTNAAKEATAIARTAGSTTVTVTASSHGFVAGQVVVVANSGSAAANGEYTVLTAATNSFTASGTATTVLALTGLTATVVGKAGTVRSVTYASGAANRQLPTSAVTVNSFAVAS